MAAIDETSEALGFIRGKVVGIDEKLTHLHSCLHAEGGAFSRISDIERRQNYERGKAAGFGAAGGAAIVALVEALATKLGIR